MESSTARTDAPCDDDPPFRWSSSFSLSATGRQRRRTKLKLELQHASMENFDVQFWARIGTIKPSESPLTAQRG